MLLLSSIVMRKAPGAPRSIDSGSSFLYARATLQPYLRT